MREAKGKRKGGRQGKGGEREGEGRGEGRVGATRHLFFSTLSTGGKWDTRKTGHTGVLSRAPYAREFGGESSLAGGLGIGRDTISNSNQ